MALEGIMGEDEGVLCVILKAVTGERGVAPGLSPCRGGSLWCVQCQAGKPVSDRSHARAGLDLYSVCGRCGAYTDPIRSLHRTLGGVVHCHQRVTSASRLQHTPGCTTGVELGLGGEGRRLRCTLLCSSPVFSYLAEWASFPLWRDWLGV